ncbi:MAG TPA: aspartate aminotransferase family protein, partial [Thermoleophilia bacterium]|nr:aspartate aminotransferase family protein [Thermoleophilia bacterium]
DRPRDWESVRQCHTDRYAAFFRQMLSEGVYLPPSQFEAAFLSMAHDHKVVEDTLQAARLAFGAVAA